MNDKELSGNTPESGEIVIASISNVSGGWHHGFSVDVNIYREMSNGVHDGYETVRVGMDRDRIVKPDGSYDMDEVHKIVQEHVAKMQAEES